MTDIKPPNMDESWRQLIQWIREQDDPTTQAIASKTLARALRTWQSELAEERKVIAGVLAAAGWTDQDIANLLGVTRSRAGQLVGKRES
jgi:hypothetical protein